MAKQEGHKGQGRQRASDRAVTSRASARATKKAIGGEGYPTTDIEPIPSKILHVPADKINALATAPRSKWSDPAWAAFCGFLGSAPSADVIFTKLFFASGSKGLNLEPTIEVIVAAIFLTLTIIAFLTIEDREPPHRSWPN